MFYKKRWLFLVIVILAMATLACTLSELIGIPQPFQEPIIITVEIPVDSVPTQPAPDQPTQEAPEPPTAVPPTIAPPTAVPPPTLIGGQLLSCVSGPHWALFQWLDKVDIGEEVALLAKATSDWEEYYFVEKDNGSTCWVYGTSSEKFGDYESLPTKEAPSLPEITYKIKNNTKLDVCNVYIRLKDDTAWGADLLGANVILPEGAHNFDLTASFYDVRIVDCWGGILFEKHAKAIGSDSNSRITKLANQIEFYIQNNFGFDLCWFHIRPVGGTWKEIHGAADGNVQPGEKAWTTTLAGIYDVSIDRCTGGVNVDFAGGVYIGPLITGFVTP